VSLCDGTLVPNRNTGFNCRCRNGFYEDPLFIGDKSKDCLECQNPCLNCYNQTLCLTCNQTDTNRRNNPPFCSCIDGFYEGSDSDKTCEICNTIKCSTCITSADNCIICRGENRGPPPACNCLTGYIESNDVCTKCNYQCSTC
jgi:hypothetical protein